MTEVVAEIQCSPPQLTMADQAPHAQHSSSPHTSQQQHPTHNTAAPHAPQCTPQRTQLCITQHTLLHTIALARVLALYHKILYFGLKPQPNTFISNPATHESARIPDAQTPYGFDHAILAYGFDYAPSIGDYKLVKAVNAPLVVVFSLKTSAWKLVEGFHYKKPTEVWKGPLPCGTHLNGALHWVFKICGGGECVIAAFDLETDTF
nr:f-box/kelch-repeat protein [Quercus suber]